MKRIYTVLRPPIGRKSYLDWIADSSQKLSISSRGLVAFTTSFCLNQSRPASINNHLYIADLNRPYQPYLLTQSGNQFITLEWDPSGTKLILTDSQGTVTIYASKNFLISNWKPVFEHTFSAETFISCLWYHTGIINTVNVPKQDLKNPTNHLEYSDKIQQQKLNCSLRLFGGRAAEGCILVSRTGLITCLTLLSDGTVDVAIESLGPLRSKIEVADISYNSDGSFIIGSSSGLINSTIAFHEVSLALRSITLDDVDSFTNSDSKRVIVTCKQYYGFHLNVMSQMLDETENTSAFEKVNQIKFVTKDSPGDVLIEVSGPNLSLIELWELEPRKQNPLHSAIVELKSRIKIEPGTETQLSSDTYSTTKEWSFKGNYINDKDLITIQVPRYKLFGPNKQLQIILLVYSDSTICCLRKEDLQPIDDIIDLSCSDSFPSSNATKNAQTYHESKSPYKVYSNPNNSNKRLIGSPQKLASQSQLQLQSGQHMGKHLLDRHNTVHITDVQFSTNQTLFVAIDSMSQLHVVRAPALIHCQDDRDEETYLQYLLEYCLVTGNDWWDVIVCIKSESIETICDKFHDAYERQPKHIQRMYFNRQLMMRAAMYRCLNKAASLCKSSDCHSMIMLNSISCTLKSMLRQYSDHQDSPAEQLTSFLRTQGSQAVNFICPNVVSKINEKEFYVEINLIQCLQPLIQWVAELAIFLVASLPQKARSQSTLLGAGLSQSKEALETLRELMIIIKIWSMQNASSSPVVYKLNDQIDVVESLYRLLSIYHCRYLMTNTEPEVLFLEECVQFTNSITLTQFLYFLEATGVASPLMHHHQDQLKIQSPNGANYCLLLEYFQEPNQPELVSLDKVEGSIDMIGARKIDVVRNISLGAHSLTNIRHCTRCRAVSLTRSPGDLTTGTSSIQNGLTITNMRVWDQRWMITCICGGSWAQSNGIRAGLASVGAQAHGVNKFSAHHMAWLQGAQSSGTLGASGASTTSNGHGATGHGSILGIQLAAGVQAGHQLAR